MEFILDCFLEWYDWSWEISSNLTIWNLVYLGIAAFFLNYFVLPYLSYLSKLLNAFCKPTNFAYQHVVITGGATGLGKALVQGVFTKGAIVTMVGKDEDKLEQLRNELDVSVVILCHRQMIFTHPFLLSNVARTIFNPTDQLCSG